MQKKFFNLSYMLKNHVFYLKMEITLREVLRKKFCKN